MSHVEHRRDAPTSVRCFVLTISDTRTAENDPSGDAIAETLKGAGHEITAGPRADDPRRERDRSGDAPCRAIVATGGTGITPPQHAWAIAALLEKRLDGFGELFRMLSYEQIGAAAMLSRACAGTIGTTVVFSLPGSTQGVRLALDTLIVPELPHIVRELKR
jgi:molybdenum cofactor biosynthesis protein B